MRKYKAEDFYDSSFVEALDKSGAIDRLVQMSVASPDPEEIVPADEPLELFREWFALAKAHEPNDADAMALATVDAQGLPDVRMVLLKHVDHEGFTFYTNLESAKGEELRPIRLPRCASIGNRCAGKFACAAPSRGVSDAEADAYFAPRAKDSQIGAWASRQSRPLEGRFALEKEVARYAAKYALSTVPRPPHWSGFRVQAVENRILARPAVPASRAYPLSARDARRRVDDGPSVSVISCGSVPLRPR